MLRAIVCHFRWEKGRKSNLPLVPCTTTTLFCFLLVKHTRYHCSLQWTWSETLNVNKCVSFKWLQLYKEDPETGKMYVALSSDSTCTNDLKSPKEGYETLVLTSIPPRPLPYEVGIYYIYTFHCECILFTHDCFFSSLGEHKFLPFPVVGSWSMAGRLRRGWYTHLQGPPQL